MALQDADSSSGGFPNRSVPVCIGHTLQRWDCLFDPFLSERIRSFSDTPTAVLIRQHSNRFASIVAKVLEFASKPLPPFCCSSSILIFDACQRRADRYRNRLGQNRKALVKRGDRGEPEILLFVGFVGFVDETKCICRKAAVSKRHLFTAKNFEQPRNQIVTRHAQ